mmetsp:Transcript_14264/g.34401  ORF Transcript_14264/g.34401 Transcript_14264/m.34401 type:complete len:1244 (+) Transcript_14264:483-4214(+)
MAQQQLQQQQQQLDMSRQQQRQSARTRRQQQHLQQRTSRCSSLFSNTSSMIATTIVVILAFSCSTVVQANLLTQPTLNWSVQLNAAAPGVSTSGTLAGRGLRQGNSIIVHPSGTKLYATADDGTLHVVDMASSNLQPTSSVLFDASSSSSATAAPSSNVFVECRSGVTLVQPQQPNGAVDEYLLYAVLDTPVQKLNDFIVSQNDDTLVPAFDTGSSSSTVGQSRVIAVNLDGSLKWSVTIPGRVEGDPVVGNGNGNGNGSDRGSGTQFVYVSHNDDDDVGSLSVIMVNNSNGSAELVATKTVGGSTDGGGGGNNEQTTVDGTGAPLGPPTIQRPLQTEGGNGNNDNDENPDVVLVGERRGDGYDTSDGRLYMLTPSNQFEDNAGRGDESYEFVPISTWPFSSPVPPVVVGDSIYHAAAGGNLAGFTGNNRNDLSGITSGRVDLIDPGWEYQVQPSRRNASQPFFSPPAVDSTGEFLVMAGVSRDLYCLQTADGSDWWFDGDGSQIVARPQIWETTDEAIVYVVEARDGMIRQHDVATGSRNWQFNCADVGGLAPCQDAVEADFAISPSGNVLYYGDIFGRISSLQVAEFLTRAPTFAPTGLTTLSPTPSSTESLVSIPVLQPTPGQGNDNDNDNDNETIDIPANEEETTIENDEEQGGDNLTGSDASLESQEQSQDNDSSNDLVLYVGIVVGALLLLVVPIAAFALVKRRRKQKSKEVVEVVDESDPLDLESSPGSTATGGSKSFGANNDLVEVGLAHGKNLRSSLGRSSRKMKKTRKSSPSLGRIAEDSPNNLNTTISTVVLDDEDGGIEIEGTSMSGVNLKDKFDRAAGSIAENGSVLKGAEGHLELAVGHNNNLSSSAREVKSTENTLAVIRSGGSGDEEDDDDDERPPPPPPPPPSGWLDSIWAGLEANAKEKRNDHDENESYVEAAYVDSSDLTEKIRQQLLAPLSPKSASVHSGKNDIAPKSPPPSDSQQLNLVKSFSPGTGSVFSIGSNDDSLYTSTTGFTNEKMVNVSNLSPLSTQIFDKEINPRNATNVPQDDVKGLEQPDLGVGSKAAKNKFYYIAPDDDDAPDDERVAAPVVRYIENNDTEQGTGKFGRSVRTRSGSNRQFVPRSSNADDSTTRNDIDVGGYSSLSSVYDQLALSLQQDTKKPSFKRRSKKTEDIQVEDKTVNSSPPAQESDTWSSFLHELAEAEKHFFEPTGQGNNGDSVAEADISHVGSEQSEIDFMNTSSEESRDVAVP